MLYEKKLFVKEKVEQLKFAILRVSGKPFLPLNRCLVETQRTDDDGNIWCTTTAALPKVLLSEKGFEVSLKFAHKEEDMFLDLKGLAYIEEYSELIRDEVTGSKVNFRKERKILLRIAVNEAGYFRKKSLSRYTSVLQSIWSFSFRSWIPGRSKVA